MLGFLRPVIDRHRPIDSSEELVGYFHAACTPHGERRIGTEHEKIGILADSLMPLPYEGPRSVTALFSRLIERGWRPAGKERPIVAIEKNGRQITLEPGAQVELSGAPLLSVHDFARELAQHTEDLRDPARELGIVWLAIGYRPFGPRSAVPWVPKPRYGIMRPYLATRGRRAHDMMQMTATAQTNLDFTDEQDCIEKMRAAMAVSPIVTAMFAASPLEDGRDTGHLSWRAAAWLETDNDRCGLLPFVFDANFGFRRYVDWALSVPMFFVARHGEYWPAHHMNFGRFLREGFQETRATIDDWETHLSTLFPEVRLRHYIEVRGADASTAPLAVALPALWKGILYDSLATQEARSLMADVTLDELQRLRNEVPRGALAVHIGADTVGERAKKLLAIAGEGLRRQADQDEARFLDPLRDIADSGRTHAERIGDLWRKSSGNMREFARAVSFEPAL